MRIVHLAIGLSLLPSAIVTAQAPSDSPTLSAEREVDARLKDYTGRQSEWLQAHRALTNTLATLDPCAPASRKLVDDAAAGASAMVKAMDNYLAAWQTLTAQRTAALATSHTEGPAAIAPDAERERDALERSLATLAKLNPAFDSILADQIRRVVRNDITGADQSAKTAKIVDEAAAAQKSLLAAADSMIGVGQRTAQTQLAKWLAFYRGKTSEISVACVNKKN